MVWQKITYNYPYLGNVEEAEGLTKLADKLREERDQLKGTHGNTVQVRIYKIKEYIK